MRKHLQILTNMMALFRFKRADKQVVLISLMLFLSGQELLAQKKTVLKEETLTMCQSHLAPVDLNRVIGVALAGGTGKWYDTLTGLPVSNIVIPDGSRNSYCYLFQVESATELCELSEGDVYQVTILIRSIPSPEGSEEQVFCYTPDNVPTLSDIAVKGSNIVWYDEASGGAILENNRTLVDGKTYYATQREAGCGESTVRLGVTVSLNVAPDIYVTNPGLHQGSYDLNLLQIEDYNETTGAITYHSSPPSNGSDMSYQLASTICYETQDVYVMKSTADGCFDIAKVEIKIDDAVVCDFELIPVIQDVACFGEKNGAITLTVENYSDVDVAFSYLWSNGATTASIQGLSAGSYSVVVSPDNGCEPITETFDVFEPDVLQLVMEVVEESAAKAGDGSATAKVSGGTPGYEYLWTDPLQQRTATAVSLGAGEYQVTVTDVNGCQISGTALLKAKLFIPDGFSPNGDDINERFVISGLEDYPNAKLEVYNRWNSLVYSKDGYGNESKWGADAWWDGRSDSGTRVGNSFLPPANYIYFLRLSPDKADVHKGIVFINR